jgi:nucleoid-associated protein YgaU
MRRRLAVLLVLAAVLCSVAWGTGQVLASRGGAPASAPTARPALAAATDDVTDATDAATATYIVQPGDTLWSLARRHHGQQSPERYLERLIEVNGGTALEVGQVVVLP